MCTYIYSIEFFTGNRLEKSVKATCQEEAYSIMYDSLTEIQQKNIVRIDLVKTEIKNSKQLSESIEILKRKNE